MRYQLTAIGLALTVAGPADATLVTTEQSFNYNFGLGSTAFNAFNGTLTRVDLKAVVGLGGLKLGQQAFGSFAYDALGAATFGSYSFVLPGTITVTQASIPTGYGYSAQATGFASITDRTTLSRFEGSGQLTSYGTLGLASLAGYDVLRSGNVSLLLSYTYDNGVPAAATPRSAVPEAATWMTLILGFGVVGLALRRYRPASATVI